MQWTKTLAMLVLWCAPYCFGQSGAAEAPPKLSSANPTFSISVTPAPGPLRLGAPINLTITAKNVSDKDIPWESEQGDTAYKAFGFSLTKNGRKIETTLFHRRIRQETRPDESPGNLFGSSILSSLHPGESLTFKIDLNRLYEIAEPGTYSLDVARMDNYNLTPVHAKTVTLEIECD
jgi:hypothetical protein